jgi:serine/threonine-protein kinase PRP4
MNTFESTFVLFNFVALPFNPILSSDDRAVDLWSVAVCLYELFTGHVMFPGRTNNEMLRLMMAVKGRVPNKLVKTHLRSYEIMNMEAHFDQDLRFKQYELDPVTGNILTVPI